LEFEVLAEVAVEVAALIHQAVLEIQEEQHLLDHSQVQQVEMLPTVASVRTAHQVILEMLEHLLRDLQLLSKLMVLLTC
jgi:hypothetical protein